MEKFYCPSFWEGLLKGYVKQVFYPGTRREGFSKGSEFTEGDYRFFAKGVARLNEFFTRERGALPKNYFNQKELRSGYLLYFLPVNALKVAALLGQACPHPTLPLTKGEGENWSLPSFLRRGAGGEVTVLDIGSGPGTGMFGTMAFLEQFFPLPSAGEGALSEAEGRVRVRWILIDQNRHALQDAKGLHDRLVGHYKKNGVPLESNLETIVWDIERGQLPPLPEADLVLVLNTLGEIPFQRRAMMVERLFGKILKEDGRVLIIEPALRSTTRDLMRLHDEIIENRIGRILSPCLHQARCPMLAANDRDWCHTYLAWERPAWIEKLDQLVGIRKDYLKCSYLLLTGASSCQERVARPEGAPRRRAVPSEVEGRASPGDTGATGSAPDSWRVVSGHLNSKGKSELLLCGPQAVPNLLRVMRLDRDQSSNNQGFDRCQRGDVAEYSGGNRISKETRFRLARLNPE